MFRTLPNIGPQVWTRRQRAGFSPLDIASLDLWLKADALSLANDDPVATWTDSSGLGHDATEATNRPLYKTGEINGLPAVLFDGSNDKLTANYTHAQPNDIWIVMKQVSWTGSDCPLGLPGSGFGTLLQQFGSGSSLRMFSSSGLAGPSDPGTTNYFITRLLFNGASSSFTINNGTPATGNPGAETQSGNVVLGASIGTFANVAIAELAIFSEVISAGNITAMWTYLNTKYAIY